LFKSSATLATWYIVNIPWLFLLAGFQNTSAYACEPNDIEIVIVTPSPAIPDLAISAKLH